MKFELLIIDDEEIVLMLIKRLVLKVKLHDNPSTFSNGVEAINYLHASSKPEKAFLIFLDINMPAFDGWEFLEMLSSMPLEGSINVVIITSSVNQSDKNKSKNYKEVIGYIEKPVTEAMMKEVSQIEKIASYLNP
ncbi:response regulator [Arthrospiribacter ruber]|uniref:Response regulator n=1 Tax=Arthrospiribacter ruber TaxID=2487934 RepID=A0A951MEP5_9BACT|nr:response regulator [Arthrospiribacter ruber]MBW3468580.1 response regulator [Arthrospiribacter ruber]